MEINGEEVTKTKKKFEKSILDNFTKLSNKNDKVRIKSAMNLIKYLNETSGKTDNEVKYAITRLIRGLGSSKLDTRNGYYITLVGLFNSNVPTTVDNVLEIITKELHKGSGNSKSENADIALGCVLACATILRSNLIETVGEKEKIIKLLLKSGKERNYLNLPSYLVLTDLFPKKISENEIKELILPEIDLNSLNLDSLLMIIEINNNYRLRESVDVITEENLINLSNILMTIPKIDSLNHPLYERFPKILAKSDLVVKFFGIVDESHLIKFNRNKLLIAIQLVTNVYENLENFQLMPDLLTKNFIKQILRNCQLKTNTKDNEFKQLLYKLFDKIFYVLKTNENSIKTKTKIKILKKLLFYPTGNFNFEKISKCRLIQNITQTLNSNGIKKFSELLKEVIKAENKLILGNDENTERSKTEKWHNLDRIYAVHLVIKLMNNQLMRNEIDWKIEQLIFLLNISLLNKNEEYAKNVGIELSELFKKSFFSSIDLKFIKFDEYRLILSKLVHHLDNKLVRELLKTENDCKIWIKTVNLIKKIDNKKNINNLYSVFHILFSYLNLQLLNDSNLANESLNELFNCFERVNNKNNNKNDPLWIEVVIELFLYLLSHSSHLIRNIINCVFPHLCQYMTEGAVDQILSVFNNETNPLLPNSNSDSEQESDNSDNDNSNNSSSDDNEESEEEDDDDNNDDSNEEKDNDFEDDDEGETVNDKLRLALQNALNTNNDNNSDNESIDLDTLDEKEGNKLNEALEEAFKQFKSNKGNKLKKQSKSDEILTHFRIRVLDLIEIYINSNPTITLCLKIMMELLKNLEFSIKNQYEKPLQDRVRFCLKKLTNLKKFSSNEEDDKEIIDEDYFMNLIKNLLEKGTKNSLIIQEMSEKISDSIIFLIKCSQRVLITSDLISSLLNDYLIVYFDKRDCLIPYVLFKNIFKLNWNGLIIFIPTLINYIFNEDIRPFRRNQGIELLKMFYNNHRLFQNYLEIKENLLTYENDFYQKTDEFFENVDETKKNKFVGNLLNLINSIKSSPGHHKEINWNKFNSYNKNNKKRKNSEMLNGSNHNSKKKKKE